MPHKFQEFWKYEHLLPPLGFFRGPNKQQIWLRLILFLLIFPLRVTIFILYALTSKKVILTLPFAAHKLVTG